MIDILLYLIDFSLVRCNVVINFFENAHRIVISDETCVECNSAILDVTFNKVSVLASLLVVL